MVTGTLSERLLYEVLRCLVTEGEYGIRYCELRFRFDFKILYGSIWFYYALAMGGSSCNMWSWTYTKSLNELGSFFSGHQNPLRALWKVLCSGRCGWLEFPGKSDFGDMRGSNGTDLPYWCFRYSEKHLFSMNLQEMICLHVEAMYFCGFNFCLLDKQWCFRYIWKWKNKKTSGTKIIY